MEFYDNYEISTQRRYNEFSRLYGQKKALKIVYKIKNSKHTASLIRQSQLNRISPSLKDFNSCVVGNLSFSFSPTDTVRFATLILIEKWHIEVNQNLNLISDQKLCELVDNIYLKVN